MEINLNAHREELRLAELKAGDQAAFKYFYDKYSPQLYRKILKMVRLQEIAEELLQDLFLKVWEKRESLDQTQSFQGYLYRIAEHMVIDHFRKSTREARLAREIALNNTELHNPTEDLINGKEFQQRISSVLESLPEMQRKVFTMCRMEGKTHDQISEQLGISKATINTHMTRAGKTIKEQLKLSNPITLAMAAAIAAGGLGNL